MSHQPLNGGLLPQKSLSPIVRTAAIAAVLALSIAVPSLRADTAGQTEIEKFIPSGKTIATCTTAQLATAVADALADTANTLTPTDIAVSALQPYPVGKTGAVTRTSTLNSDGSAVVASAITELINLGKDTKFATDVGSMVDGVISVNQPTAGETLSEAGREAVAEQALGVISDASLAGTTALSKIALLQGVQYIGYDLTADKYLEALPNDALTTIDEDAMAYVAGADGKNTSGSGVQAENFAYGLVSTGTVPDSAQGQTFASFEITLLHFKYVNVNIDEYVSYEFGLKDANTSVAAHQAALVTLAEALYTAYPAAITKVTQGLADSIPAGTNAETNRIAFAQALTTGTLASAVPILEGAVYSDPYYGSQFTNAVFTSIYAKSPATLLTDATSAAVSVGNVLGADGNELTQVANVYGTFLAAKKLAPASAGIYATDLISGAVNSPISVNQFVDAPGSGGGDLHVGTGITAATCLDLTSIEDLIADGVVKYYGTAINTTDASLAASEIGTIAEDVAKFTTNETFTDPADPKAAGYVASFLAGTLADYIISLDLDGGSAAAGSPQTLALNDIEADVEAVTNSTVDTAVTTAINQAKAGDSAYVGIDGGPIAVQETTVTNL